MATWRVIGALRSLLHRGRLERELDEELRHDLEQREQDHRRAGLSPADAARRARHELGGPTQVREACRDERRGARLDTVVLDGRYAMRALRRNPTFSLVAIMTLALGIGANTAIFSVVHHLLIRPLPYPQAQRLAIVWMGLTSEGASRYPVSGPLLVELQRRNQTLAGIAGIWANSGTLAGDEEPLQLRVGNVTANFFDVLGAVPAGGRTFRDDDAGAGRRGVLVISDRLWRVRFGAAPDVVGREVRFDGESRTIVGVMPPDFALRFPADAKVPSLLDAWVPFRDSLEAGPIDVFYLRLLARLRPEATIGETQADLARIAGDLRAERQVLDDGGLSFDVVEAQADAMRHVRRSLLIVFGAVSVVLLISCANVANLLLARAAGRRGEFALRASLGASTGRLVRQLLCESVVLFALAGGLGAIVALFGLDLLWALRPEGLSDEARIPLSAASLLFTLGVSLVSGLVFGLVPMIEVRRLNLTDGLRNAARVGAATRGAGVRQALIIGEVALGFVLLVGAGLLTHTLYRLHALDPGFEARQALTFRVSLPFRQYPSTDDRAQAWSEIQRRIAAIAGVEAVGAISHLPLDDEPNWSSPFVIGEESGEQGVELVADHRAILPGYFAAIGGRLVAGREFDGLDVDAGRRVAIVDRSLAETAWPGEPAVGKRMRATYFENGQFVNRWADVVGVVEHIAHHDLGESGLPQVYLPFAQCARPQATFVVRAAGDTAALIAPARRAVAGFNGELAISKVRAMEDLVRRALAGNRFLTVLLGGFAILALLLASIGLYGVLAYTVSQQRREFGIRLALGASPGSIWRAVVGRGLALTLGGLALGLALALALRRVLAGLLFDVSPADPLTLMSIAALLTAVGLLACHLPARRAMRIDPMRTLRAD